jgi:hypothetical protein
MREQWITLIKFLYSKGNLGSVLIEKKAAYVQILDKILSCIKVLKRIFKNSTHASDVIHRSTISAVKVLKWLTKVM